MPDPSQSTPSSDLRARTAEHFIELLKQDDSTPDDVADALATVMKLGTVSRETVLAALVGGARATAAAGGDADDEGDDEGDDGAPE